MAVPTVPAHTIFLDPEERYEVCVVKAAERPHPLPRFEPSAPSSPPLPSLEEDGAKDARATGDGRTGGADHVGGREEEKKDDDDCGGGGGDDGGAGEDGKCSNDAEAAEKVAEADDPPPPLVDGTDLPLWREHSLAATVVRSGRTTAAAGGGGRISDEVEGLLNVGPGSALFRRSDQLTCVMPRRCAASSRNPTPIGRATGGSRRRMAMNAERREAGGGLCWDELRDLLASNDPPAERDADVVDAAEYAELVVPVDDRATTTDEGGSAGNGGDGGGDGFERRTTRFALEYERRNLPAKILGAADGWEAMPTYGTKNDQIATATNDDDDSSNNNCDDMEQDVALDCNGSSGGGGWTFQNLLGRFPDVYWRFSDVHGEMLTLRTYAKYLSNVEGLTDDSPLAIYDAEFGDADSPTCVLTNEYEVPKCFSQDLFELAVDPDGAGEVEQDGEEGCGGSSSSSSSSSCCDDGSCSSTSSSGGGDGSSKSRPPYRWILIGPERSGTGLHVDPLWTNAWVTVLQGLKRWVLFPPSTPPHKIGMIDGQPQIPSSVWFLKYYDEVTGPDWPVEWRPVEVLQRPGETVFVPNGWPHAVLNLDLTVAVTHNYASEHGPFERMWEEVAREEPDFAVRWYKGLMGERADLAERIRACHRANCT